MLNNVFDNRNHNIITWRLCSTVWTRLWSSWWSTKCTSLSKRLSGSCPSSSCLRVSSSPSRSAPYTACDWTAWSRAATERNRCCTERQRRTSQVRTPAASKTISPSKWNQKHTCSGYSYRSTFISCKNHWICT